jgi:hypothetical protein
LSGAAADSLAFRTDLTALGTALQIVQTSHAMREPLTAEDGGSRSERLQAVFRALTKAWIGTLT